MGLCLSKNKKNTKIDNLHTHTFVEIINYNFSNINEPYSESWMRFRYG